MLSQSCVIRTGFQYGLGIRCARDNPAGTYVNQGWRDRAVQLAAQYLFEFVSLFWRQRLDSGGRQFKRYALTTFRQWRDGECY